MTDAIADDVLQAALSLRRSHPQAPALDVLDLAMKGREHTDPDFYTDALPAGTWLVPPNHFASLLRDAFDASLTDDQLIMAAGGHPPDLAQRWVVVVDRFARRYDLWRPWRMMPAGGGR